MRKYWEILKSQVKLDINYTAWYWSNMLSNILRVLVIYSFWKAVYENLQDIANIDLKTMITYAILAMILNNYMVGMGPELAKKIREGDVAVEIIRPYDLLIKLIAMDLGSKLTRFFRDTIPILFLSFFFLKINYPMDISTFVISVISALLGVLIGSQLDLIIGILAFWLTYIWGLRILKDAVILLFSGALIPITLFPNWLQAITNYLPFQAMIYTPVAIYTEQLSGNAMYIAIIIQIIWLIVVFFIIRLVWVYALRNITIYGG
ncbi:ABC transporter permease [Bacillus pseudomycoides]|uniref:ABC transporter permease n=1 Tax=Bacillus pseudomycoides TaxID=64104 RepID=UPI000BF285BF|nr:ABC-2 family transporter protein [Bacillus pseudomycoides]PEP84918.1 hypothetical protein CN584_13645 [Bacillus pseudomycoides]